VSLPRSGTAPYLVALFAVYLVLLVWTVLWKLEAPWVGGATMVKLVPFVSTDRAGASAPVEVVVNVALFVPFGLYLGLLAPARRRWVAPAAVAGTSLALEVAQYLLGVGRSDSTDLVVNTAGGLAGLGLLALARRMLGARTQAVMTRACSVGTAITLLVGGAYLASPWRPVHVHDVGPLARVGVTAPAAPAPSR
jgi:glycopeptide antibiotics resistance protein